MFEPWPGIAEVTCDISDYLKARYYQLYMFTNTYMHMQYVLIVYNKLFSVAQVKVIIATNAFKSGFDHTDTQLVYKLNIIAREKRNLKKVEIRFQLRVF